MKTYLRRFRLSQQIIVMAAVVALPMACAAFYFIANGINKDIAAAQLERHGNTFQQPLETLLRAIAEHGRLALAKAGGDSVAAGKIGDVESQVEAAWKHVRKTNAEYGKELQFTTEGLKKRHRDHVAIETVEQEWEAAKSGTLDRAAVVKAHRHLADDIRMMITHVGDTSGLILDPDLDSYYLMDATLCALPQTQDRISDLISYVAQLPPGELSADSRIHLATVRAMLQDDDLSRIQSDMQTALNEDAGFNGVSASLQGSLPTTLKTYSEATQKLIDSLQAVQDSGRLLDPAAFLQTAMGARNASFAFWNQSEPELNTLLDMRVGNRQSARAIGLGSMATALLLSGSFAFYLFRDLNSRLDQVVSWLGNCVSETRSAVASVRTGSAHIADAVSNQARSAEEASAASAEVSSAARANSDLTRAMTDSTAESVRKATLMKESMNALVAAMTRIRETGEKTASVLKSIEGIAGQTNILALNAAVEAARAGEAGLGFAVVADEVRALAGRCSEAAKNTSDLIEKSMSETALGSATVRTASSEMQALDRQSTAIAASISRIQSQCEGQVRGLGEVVKRLSGLQQAMQNAAAGAEESAAAAEQLSGNANNLELAAAEIRQIVHGQR